MQYSKADLHVGKSKQMSDRVEQAVGGMIGRGLRGRRAERGAGLVEELILEPGHHVGDGLAVGLIEPRAQSAERLELTLSDGVDVVAKLPKHDPGVALMP